MIEPIFFLLAPYHNSFSHWKSHLLSCYPNGQIQVIPFQKYLQNKTFFEQHPEQLFCITDTDEILKYLPPKSSKRFPCNLPIAGILPASDSDSFDYFLNTYASKIMPDSLCTSERSTAFYFPNDPLESTRVQDIIPSVKPVWDLKKLPYLFEGIDTLDAESIAFIYSRFHEIPLTILETSRLHLREWALSDLEILKQLYHDFPDNPSIHCPWKTEEEAKTWLQSYIEKAYHFYGYGLWCMEHKSTHQIIGQIGIEYKEKNQVGYHEFQYMLFPEYQNRGYALEIGQAVCHYAKETLHLLELSSFISPLNLPSLRLAKKLHFQDLGKYEIDGHFFRHFSQSF